MTSDIYETLQEKIGWHFRDPRKLKAALTHASMGEDGNYERLEFLGDRVLGLIMAHILFDAYPDEAEGGLAKRHAALVQGSTVASVARHIDLGRAVILSDAERNAGGAGNENLLADGMEALIGALYLDAGLDTCRTVIAKLWDGFVCTMKEPPQDPKTALQEWAQAQGLSLPVYDLARREGPDHAPLFTVQVSVEGHPPAQASGASRRTAEKKAAQLLLDRVTGKRSAPE